MREPVFEFIRPPVYHPPQVKYPHGKPLRYLERYRDGKQHTYGIYWYWGTQSHRGMCCFCLTYLCDIIKHFQLYWGWIVCLFFLNQCLNIYSFYDHRTSSVSVAQNICKDSAVNMCNFPDSVMKGSVFGQLNGTHPHIHDLSLGQLLWSQQSEISRRLK